jgi:hypothetical protein
MVSSKLRIKKQNRNKLFYDKFLYRAEFNSLGVSFILTSKAKTLQDCINRIKRFNDNVLRNPWYMSNREIDASKLALPLLEQTITFYNKYKDKKQEVTFLRSGYSHSVFTMYTNDVSVLEELVDISKDTEIIEAVTPPSEVMYFAKEPTYDYRVYLKSKLVSPETINCLRTFHMNNQNKGKVWLSNGISQFLGRTKRGHLPTGCYIDFNDEQTLTQLYLLFGECLHKSYKLEKRPES